MNSIQAKFERLVRVDLRFLLIVLIASRVSFLLIRVWMLVNTGSPADFRYWLDIARMSDRGLYPHLNFWMEYPPVFPWMAVAVYRVSALLASGVAAAAWFYFLVGLILVACEVGVVLLLYRLALLLMSNADTARRSAWLYVLCFVPGYLWSGWFDNLPTLLFLSSLYLLLTERRHLSALAAGLGLVTKLFPILMLPLALASLRKIRAQIGYLLAAVLLAGFVLLPFLLASRTMFFASLRNMASRPSWETVWAVLCGFYGYGLVAPLAEHLNPATAVWGNHADPLPWGLITLTFGFIYLLFYKGIWGVRQRAQLVAAAAFGITLLLIYSKGYSPQYLTWVAALIVVLFPNRRGVIYLGGLSLLNLMELPGYFSFFPGHPELFVVTVLARTGVLVLLASDCLALALSGKPLLVLTLRSWSRRQRQHGW